MLHKFCFATALLLSIVCCSDAQAQTVTFNTNAGDIVVELFTNEAPISVENFLGYVERGDYDGTIFHRSVTNFVIQGGGFIPAGLSPIPVQPTIENEFGRSNLRGTLALARQGGNVNSASNQFFFNVTDNIFLDTVDEGFTVFGEVVSGLEIVDAINDFQIVTLGFSPFTELPVQAIQPDNSISLEDLVILNEVTIVLLGDCDLNGVVNFADIATFISFLSTNDYLAEADVNSDGAVNFADISSFISILSS